MPDNVDAVCAFGARGHADFQVARDLVFGRCFLPGGSGYILADRNERVLSNVAAVPHLAAGKIDVSDVDAEVLQPERLRDGAAERRSGEPGGDVDGILLQ